MVLGASVISGTMPKKSRSVQVRCTARRKAWTSKSIRRKARNGGDFRQLSTSVHILVQVSRHNGDVRFWNLGNLMYKLVYKSSNRCRSWLELPS